MTYFTAWQQKGAMGGSFLELLQTEGIGKKRLKSKNANLKIGVPRWKSQDYLETIICELPRPVKEKDGEKTSGS
jgi:hypothetical protein